MGFLKPKMPPLPPPPPPMPVLPPATTDDFEEKEKAKVKDAMTRKKKAYTETILTSPQGVISEADIYKKTLLGA